MNEHLLNGIASTMFSLGLFCGLPTPAGAYRSYTRSYARQNHALVVPKSEVSSFKKTEAPRKPSSRVLQAMPENKLELKSFADADRSKLDRGEHSELVLKENNPIRELVIIDAAVPDKHIIYQQLKQGAEAKEIQSGVNGLEQLKKILSSYKNLEALHVFSHADDGLIQLGSTAVTQVSLEKEIHTLSALDRSMKDGADLLLYGCNLAKTDKGEALLELISNKANVDVAASNDLTGASFKKGDWDLEIQKGIIDNALPFDSIAMADFTAILPFSGTLDLNNMPVGYAASLSYTIPTTSYEINFVSNAAGGNDLYGYGGAGGLIFAGTGGSAGGHTSTSISFSGGETFNLTSLEVYNGDDYQNRTIRVTSNLGGSVDSASLVSRTSEVLNFSGADWTGVTQVTIQYDTGTQMSWTRLDDIVIANLAAANSAPSITINSSTLAYIEGNAATQIDSAATVSDSDGDADWNGGSLAVQITGNAEAGDEISISDTDGDGIGITISGTNIFSNGVDIGDLSSSGGVVTNNTSLTITFDSDATNANVQEVLQSLRYRSTSDSPGTSNRTVTVTATDTNSAAANDIRTISVAAHNNDGSLTAAGGVSEPVGIDTTLDTTGEAVDVFDFTLSDGGGGDGQPMAISQLVFNVSGTSSDTIRDQITWRLNGNDASNVTGVYSSGADTITFSSLSISIADGGSETYTVNAYFNDNTGIIEDQTVILSIDGDTDVTVDSISGTGMGSTSAVNNGTGSTLDIVTTGLAFAIQPSGSVSGSALSIQPVVTARDAFGNTDVDFTETITLTESSSGSLTNSLVAASAGVATFSGLTYTATADQQSFTLTANDQDGVGSDLSTVDANAVTSDVVATQLAFSTQPAPLSVTNGITTAFTTVPVVSAEDGNGIVDTGYSTGITLAEVNGAGSATMTGTGDTDGSGATVTITPSSGVSTFTGMQITYTASGGSSENFNLQASSGGLSAVNSSQLTGLVPDSDGTLTTAAPVSEPVDLAWSIDTVGEAVDLFDFTLSDGGTADGLAMTVSQVVLNVSGTASDTDRNKITWRLNGSDASNVTGTYSSGADTITFSGLSISVANGASEIYTVNGYYNDNTGLTHGDTIILSVDGDTNLTIGGSGSQMGSTSAINNGTGTTLSDDIAPVVSSVTVPANATYTVADNLDFTVNFNENVTVNTGGGTPRLPLTLGSTTRYASYLSGSGTSALFFRYTVSSGDEDTDGIALAGALDTNSGTLRDAAGNDINTTLNSVGGLTSVLVDGIAPSVAEVTAVTTPDNDTTPNVTISSNEAGTLAVGGSCGSSDEGAISSGNTTITLTQTDNSSALSDGTYSDCTITVTDAAGNSNTAVTLTSFEIDETAPSVVEVTAVVSPGSDTTPDVTISSNEAGTLAVGGSCGSSDEGAIGSGNTTITLTQTDNSSALSDGTYSDCTITVTDAAGNSNTAVTLTSFEIDETAPSVAEVTAVVSPGSDTTPDVTISSNEAGTLAVGGSCGSASEGSISSGNTTITLTQTDNSTALSDGTYSDCTITVTDAAGNANSPIMLSSFVVDTDAPTVAEVTAVVSPGNDSTPNVTISSNEAGTLAVGGSCGSSDEGAIGSGNTTITLTQTDNSSALSDGTYSDCTITVTDAAGGASSAINLSSFTIDLTGPSMITNAGISLNEGDTDVAVENTALAATDTISSASDISYTLVTAPVNGTLRLSGSALSTSSTFTQSDIDSSLLSYDHDGSETTSDTFTFTLSDGLGNVNDNASANFTFGVTVTAQNDAPVSVADTALTNEDNMVAIDVLANDSDADDGLNAASVTVVSSAANGSTSVNTGTGVITFTPNADFNGADSFSYTVEDAAGEVSPAALVSVTVNAVNDAPLAADDSASTEINTLTLIDVADNDSDVDTGDAPDPSTINIVSMPSNGSASVVANEISYTPDLDFVGNDSLTYTIEDASGALSNVATLILSVFDPNLAPVAVNDSASTDEDVAVDIDVLDNDSDSDGALEPSSVTVVSAPSSGTTSVNTDTGVITYTPTADSNGSDSFSYTVEDELSEMSAPATVTVTVNAINDAPVANNDVVSLMEDASLSVNVLGNDLDVDGMLAPESVIVVDQPSSGVVAVNTGTGAITYTPVGDFAGNDVFSYRVSDDLGLSSDIATVSLTVDPINDAPLANADSFSVVPGESTSLSILENDSDVDGTLDLSSIEIVSEPSQGSLADNNDGTLSYTSNESIDVSAPDSFSYRVDDNEGGTSNTVTVTLNYIPGSVPVIEGEPEVELEEGGEYRFEPSVSSEDANFDLSYAVENQPSWMQFDSETGVLSGTPDENDVGVFDNIVVSVSDGFNTVSLDPISITVFERVDTDGDTITDFQERQDQTDANDAEDYLDITPPVLTAPADIIVDATGLKTQIGIARLLGLSASADQQSIDSALGALATDNVDGEACCGVRSSELEDGSIRLSPGAHVLSWQATDRKDNTTTVIQNVYVRPLVSVAPDSVSVEGASPSIKVILNGNAPFYPLEIPFVIDAESTASSEDHNLVDGSVIFEQGQTQARIELTIMGDAETENMEVLVLRLDDRTDDTEDLADGFEAGLYDINSSSRIVHRLSIVEQNIAPQVRLLARQSNVQTSTIVLTEGNVLIDAAVFDPNPSDIHSYSWSSSNAAIEELASANSGAQFEFDASLLSAGVVSVSLQVNDGEGGSDTSVLHLLVVAEAPNLLAENDSDSDGIDDLSEGLSDIDGDGIPEYLDNIEASNVLPDSVDVSDPFLIECDPGVRCRLGEFALQAASGGGALTVSDIETLPGLVEDEHFDFVDTIFDFELLDLPIPGQQTRVVIPQTAAVPENAIYRKFINGAWVTFVEDSANQIHSAEGELGFCPPPGDGLWQSGLVAGSFCVQLTIEDGGPNDADGLVNAAVSDPGGVSVQRSSRVQASGGGSVDLMHIALMVGLLFSLTVRSKKLALRSILVVAVMAGSLPVSARADASEKGFDTSKLYLEVSLMQAGSDQSRGGFVSDMGSRGIQVSNVDYDETRWAYRLDLGYQINEKVFAFIGLAELGDVDLSFDVLSEDADIQKNAIEQSYPLTGSGALIGVGYRFNVAQKINLSADAGYFYWSGDIDTNLVGVDAEYDGGFDPFVGLNAEYEIAKSYYVSTLYEYYSLESGSVTSWGVSLRKTFK